MQPAKLTPATLIPAKLEAVDLKSKSSPLDCLPDLGSNEANCVAELNSVRESFAERARRDQERWNYNCDSDFFSVLVFQTSEQAAAFHAAIGAPAEEKYINGILLAERLGIELPPAPKPQTRYQMNSWTVKYIGDMKETT